MPNLWGGPLDADDGTCCEGTWEGGVGGCGECGSELNCSRISHQGELAVKTTTSAGRRYWCSVNKLITVDWKVIWSAEERQTCISFFSLSSSAAFRFSSECLRGGSGICWTCRTFTVTVSVGFVWHLVIFFSYSLFGFSCWFQTFCLWFFFAIIHDSIKHNTVWILKTCPVIWLSQLQIKQNNMTDVFLFLFNLVLVTL